MDRNKLKIFLGSGTIASLVVAVVLLILVIALDFVLFPRLVLIIVSVLAFALAVELGYFTWLMMDKNPNYFLYNSQTKRNISVQKLTFQTINARMNRFLSNYASSEGKIWNDRIFDNPYLEMSDEFRPLVAYKLLYSLAEKDVDAGWKCLENASEDTVLFICNGLEMNNDKEFSSNFAQLMQRPVNIKLVRDYLVRSKRYMQSKMMKYVVDNIDRFLL